MKVTLLCQLLFFSCLLSLTTARIVRNRDFTNDEISYKQKDGISPANVFSAGHREKRNIMQLNDMVKEVIGRSGMDFVGYGNWCGPGGGGQPVDPIDTCCAIHDFCYNKIIAKEICSNGESGILYSTNYDWHVEEIGDDSKKTAECGENSGMCKKVTCHCDTQIVNCFQENMDSYRDENLHSLGLDKLLDMVFANGR